MTPNGNPNPLPIPYLSQNTPSAALAPASNCGPACLAMAIHHLTTHTPTVDQVTTAADLSNDAHYATLTHIRRAAHHYGLTLHTAYPLTRQLIITNIDNGHPIIALVKYSALVTPTDPNQNKHDRAHFILIIGYTHTNVIYHDPDRLHGDQFGKSRTTPWEVFMHALRSLSDTPGNFHNNLGLTFHT